MASGYQQYVFAKLGLTVMVVQFSGSGEVLGATVYQQLMNWPITTQCIPGFGAAGKATGRSGTLR